MTGDGDIVHLEHTLALYRALRESELAVVPGTSHVLLHEKPELCARLVEAFLTEDFPNGRAAHRSRDSPGSSMQVLPTTPMGLHSAALAQLQGLPLSLTPGLIHTGVPIGTYRLARPVTSRWFRHVDGLRRCRRSRHGRP
jgi:hypothetical protein